ncbi:PREDICTED: uncharacterized protein KIAA1671 homolog [Thamnophis sirtalis]|uniref:Uncharacterized protein KIAA1671 homolog n=1 Tax=Thamnophis sirtalis TaxID=35019 RepID=A0A6I9Z5T9_9SAUR|nr:PREDICTED: uncharacterized protein KIAA1671 homolog [Thamnophis sirtalis]
MRPLRAMATQVELGSSLTSLASIREPRTEAAFRHSFLTSLSDSSRKPGEGPRALALLIPEGRGNPMGPATMPSTASRPPWTPKPFSRETSSDTFATVKPPVPALKPSHATPKPPTFAQTFEDAAKGSPGNVPPLLDQKPMESKGPLEPVAHLPFYLSPQANTVILFESRGPAKGRAEEGGSKAQEGQLLRSQSEKWPRRQPSLSTDPRPVSWAPRWKEAFAGAPKGPATQQSPAPATETHSQVGGRPAASAGFGRSWQEQRQPAPPEAASGPGSPKPKPLPLDLTGIFEPRDPSWQKKPSLAESGEKSFPAAGDGALEATGARSAAASSSGAAPSGPRAKSAGQLAESPQGCLPSAPPGQTLPEEAGRKGAQEETVAWEPGKPSVGQPSASQGQPLGERAEVPPQQGGLRNASDGNQRGCAKKTLLLPDPPGNPWAPTESESLRGSPGQETGTLNIQQRIQVLTAEKAGAKTGGLRRSFRSRPLSTDLTQMFSGPVAADELKAKRQPGWNRKPARERQEAPEEETLPMGGADVGEAGMAGSPWKPPLLARTPSGEEPPKRDASVPGEDPSVVLGPKARTLSSSSTEDSCPKTVRATMFEHHVQRHSVVASQIGPEPALVPPRVPFGGSPSRAQEFWKERMLGDGWVAKASVQKEAGGLRDPRPLTEDEGSPTRAEDPLGEKGEQPASKGMEDSLLAQRIEPRYEILQTVGERAQSEAVAAVSGGKAVTLRRQRYLKENRRAGGYGKSEAWGGASPPGRGPLKDHPASGIQAAFYSEATGPERNRAGQQAASSKMKDDGNFAPLLETEKERGLAPAGVTEGPKALGCTRQWAGARAPGADGWEGRVGVLDQQTSRGQNASCPGFLFGLHLKPPQGPEDSEGQERRSTRSAAAQEKWEATAEGKQPPELNIGARWASSFRDASAPRGSDRWRRKTLPHGSARLEDTPQGPAQLASRRGTPRPAEEGSAAKGSSQTPCGPEPRQPEKPLSPSEPKATYFAVTCQISEINNPPRAAAAPHASACPRPSSRRARRYLRSSGGAMESLGEKLAGAQSQVNRWVGSVRRSLHEALSLVTAAVAPERAAGEGPARAPFKRTASFRQLASRGRDSFRQFSVRSQRRLSSLRKRPAGGPEQPPPELRTLTGSLTPESPSSSEGSEAPAQKPESPSRPASLHSTQRAPAADQRGSSREQRSHSLDNSSHLQAEPASPTTEKDSPDFSFLEQTPRLDCGVLKSRVLLGKKLQQHRAPISHTLRRGASGDPQPAPIAAGEGAASAWMFRDCTEEKPPRAGEEEEESPPAERPFSSQPRLPLFPGLAPSALKAQLRKRPESEGRREEAPPAPLCKSPKGPVPARVSGGRALVATPKKEGRPEEVPPAWLTELKSRREQGQPESPI